MKLLQLLLCSISLCLMGCPYESSVPIGGEVETVDEHLLGKWRTNAESYSVYMISKLNNNEYRIQQNLSTGDVKFYKAHLVEVRSNTFLNVFSDSTKAYYLYRIRMDKEKNSFSLTPFSENLAVHFANPEGLRNYVEKHMNLQSTYADFTDEYFKISEGGTQ